MVLPMRASPALLPGPPILAREEEVQPMTLMPGCLPACHACLPCLLACLLLSSRILYPALHSCLSTACIHPGSQPPCLLACLTLSLLPTCHFASCVREGVFTFLYPLVRLPSPLLTSVCLSHCLVSQSVCLSALSHPRGSDMLPQVTHFAVFCYWFLTVFLNSSYLSVSCSLLHSFLQLSSLCFDFLIALVLSFFFFFHIPLFA